MTQDIQTMFRGLMNQYRDTEGEDYEGQGWSKVGFEKRHQLLSENIPWNRQWSVLDLGCGNGALMERLCEDGHTPDTYVGVDMLLERGSDIETRVGPYVNRALFVHKPLDVAFENLPFSGCSFDVVMAIGIAGSQVYPSLASVERLWEGMKRMGRHTLMSFSTQYADVLCDEYMVRFAKEDLHRMFAPSGYKMFDLERETVVWR